jgi:hypothetical protein
VRKLWAATVVAAAALAGCASGPNGPTGTVTGHLEMVGGPVTLSGGRPVGRPVFLVPGAITAVSGSATFHASAAKDASFTLVLPDGTYTVTGTSPQDDDGKATCVAAARVTVRTDKVTRADVICEIS